MSDIKSHDFEVNGGEEVVDGKAHWPDCLNVKIPNHKIWNIIIELVNHLKYQPGSEHITLGLMGKLDRDVPDD